MKTIINDYTKQAEKFMTNCGATMTAKFLRNDKYFEDDKKPCDIYHIAIERNGQKMELDFGQSIAKNVLPREYGKKRVAPTAYDVLACLTKYEVADDVWDFAKEFGYIINSRKSLNAVDRTHMAVVKEYHDVCRLFGDVMEQLCEIN